MIAAAAVACHLFAAPAKQGVQAYNFRSGYLAHSKCGTRIEKMACFLLIDARERQASKLNTKNTAEVTKEIVSRTDI